jgi:hypothetical protein
VHLGPSTGWYSHYLQVDCVRAYRLRRDPWRIGEPLLANEFSTGADNSARHLGQGQRIRICFNHSPNFVLHVRNKIVASNKQQDFERPAISCFICRNCGSNCRVCPFSAVRL